MASPFAIELAGASLELGRRVVLDDLSAVVPAGACCALIGPNGCGKSTLGRLLTGYLQPTRGRVCVLGRTLGACDVHALRREVQLVQARPPVERDPDLTARDVVLTGYFGTLDLHDPVDAAMAKRAGDLMGQLGVDHVARQPFGTLSTGEQMRTLIARALTVRPGLVVLDEPAGGLDLVARERLVERLDAITRAADRPTVVVVTHHAEELPARTDHALLMSAGRLVAAGPAEQVLTDPNCSAAFGLPVAVGRDGGRWSMRLRR